jgi:hypothetical protein
MDHNETNDGKNSYVHEQTEPKFDTNKEDDKMSDLVCIGRVRCYSKRFYPKSCTDRIRYYYETFKTYPTPDTRPMEWAEDRDDWVELGPVMSTQYEVYNSPNPPAFYATTANGDIMRSPSTASNERFILFERASMGRSSAENVHNKESELKTAGPGITKEEDSRKVKTTAESFRPGGNVLSW